MHRTSSAISIAGLLTAGLLMPSAASATAPPPKWDNQRTLDCGGTTVEAQFTPGGPFTSFHVVGSTDVIIPKHIEVVFPGTTTSVTTLHVPGFDKNRVTTVVCSYMDPAGLAVELTGIRG
jgi:hypothetical protein